MTTTITDERTTAMDTTTADRAPSHEHPCWCDECLRRFVDGRIRYHAQIFADKLINGTYHAGEHAAAEKIYDQSAALRRATDAG